MVVANGKGLIYHRGVAECPTTLINSGLIGLINITLCPIKLEIGQV